ncbi:hypothetical protein LOZ39_002401, partial [Ophidiomyces ophidiicola]
MLDVQAIPAVHDGHGDSGTTRRSRLWDVGQLVGQADGVHGPLQQRAPGDVERAEDGLEQLAAPALRPPAGVETAQDDAVVGEDDQGHGAAGLEVCE